MGKVFVKHTFDMNDGDYVYGCQILGKEEWEKFKKWVEQEDYISVYHNNDDRERPFSDVELKVTDITEEQEQFLTKLGMDDFGMDIPGMVEYEYYLYNLEHEEDEEDGE